jgi:hypothetical protein
LQLFDYWRQICRLGVSSRSQGFYGHRAHLLLGTTPRLPPSFVPRRLAAASASLVRLLIIRRSSSATIAMMPTVSRLAFGISAATKSTPAFSSPSKKIDLDKFLHQRKGAPQRL